MRRIVVEAAGGAIAALLSTVGMVLALRLWHLRLEVPLQYHGDNMLALMTVRNMQTTGWFQTSDLLNAPLGQSLLAYPSSTGDLWNLVGLKALSLWLSPAATVNVFYLLGFPLVAVSAYACLRLSRVSLPVAVTIAAVYSWLPYHFLRGESHLFLSNYAAVPILCVLVLAIFRMDRSTSVGRGRVVAGLAGAVLLSGTGLYYAAFFVTLLAAAGLLASVARRTWRPLLTAIAMGTTTVVVLVASAWPNISYLISHGSAVDGRGYFQTEFYGLKITNLLLPVTDHRIGLLAQFRENATNTAIPGEGMEALGIIGAAGAVLVVLAALLPRVEARNGRLLARWRELGALTIIALLVSTVAGVSAILSAGGFTFLRAWNRMSVVIAFLVLLGAALGIDALIDRVSMRRPRWREVVAWPVAVVLSVVGLLDQTTDANVPQYQLMQALWHDDSTFYTQVEQMLPPGTSVFQLPVAGFPEAPAVNSLDPYDLLTGYLHTSTLSWSFGGVKGGDGEWQTAAVSDGVPAALPKIVATGFRALLVDRRGYADHGAAVEKEIRDVVGDVPTVVDPGQATIVYDIGAYADRLAASGDLPSRQEVLSAPHLSFGDGFYDEESVDGSTYRWATGEAHATIINPGERRRVVLTGFITTLDPGATVDVQVGDQSFHLAAAGGQLALSVPVEVDQGVTAVTLTTDSAATPSTAGDTRDLRQQVSGLRLLVGP